MQDKRKTVYVETTIPSHNAITLLQQGETQAFWKNGKYNQFHRN
jgi:hypothetical protein